MQMSSPPKNWEVLEMSQNFNPDSGMPYAFSRTDVSTRLLIFWGLPEASARAEFRFFLERKLMTMRLNKPPKGLPEASARAEFRIFHVRSYE